MMPAPRTVGPHRLRLLQGSPEWLAARREYITATDITVIAGVNPYRVEADLANEKRTGDGVDSTLVMRVGSALEDLILDAYSEQTGRKARHVRGLWVSRHVPWAAASPDATAAGRLVELKWSGNRSRFADGLPEDVEIQAAWQAFVAEVDEVDVATLTVGDPELRIFTVRRDDGLIRHLVALAADFRRRLEEGGPFAHSLDSVKRLYPRDNGVEMVADAHLEAKVTQLLLARAERDLAKSRVEEIEAEIKARMGEIAVVRGSDFRVTWKKATDSTVTDWKAVAADLLATVPEPEREALVGRHVTVQEGARYFRVTRTKEREA